MAPAIGWAAYTVLALPILTFTGFGTAACTVCAALAAASAWLLWRSPTAAASKLPVSAVVLAAAMGVLPLMAIMPKPIADGVLLGPPMFDHVKIALVDGILRDGLPVPNPFYGPQDPGHLAYYYLWHFGAAQLARLLHIGGWQAEAALTGFTAFSSIMLVTGLAIALGGRSVAIAAATLLCLPGSLRPVLEAAIGAGAAKALIPPGSDIGNWLNQAAWVPQHMASATCVLLSTLLMLRLADGGWRVAGLLGLTVAAGFESSIWVGGVAFAVAGTALGLHLLWHGAPDERRAILGRGLAAACLAALLIAPFVAAELHGLAARHSGSGVTLAPYAVFGSLVPPGARALLDLPGFWLLMLPFAFPALYPLGAVAMLRPRTLDPPPAARSLTAALTITAGFCLASAWLFRSTLDNNDLGWRAVLPALLILAPFAARLIERLLSSSSSARSPALAACALFAGLGMPQTVKFVGDYAYGYRPGDPSGFARAEPLWNAVRRLSGPNERIANNPLAVQDATLWSDNIAWALLADRPSCYAGWESVLAYGGMSRSRLETIDARFKRVFDGTAQQNDLGDLATGDNCRLAVLTRSDPAWSQDPFAGSALYRLVEQAPGWRIYRRADLSETARGVAAAASAPASASSGPAARRGPPSRPGPPASSR